MSFQEAVGRLKAFEERTKKAVKEEDGSSSLFFSKVDEKEKTKEHKCEHCGCGNASQKDFGRGQGRGYLLVHLLCSTSLRMRLAHIEGTFIKMLKKKIEVNVAKVLGKK
ncbi:hypothetical protein CTI12_AA583140 [Artemisia annua]|uniref:Zinc finger, CCHC-type n=1 Tax=Artemisia annua TaxID=35608 RepID=A0A2U1KNF2_ARTAN|nr:hypothetical protein CTI12_AA583140 [Artemisia annua]